MLDKKGINDSLEKFSEFIEEKLEEATKTFDGEKIIIDGVECYIRKITFPSDFKNKYPADLKIFNDYHCGYINIDNIEQEKTLRKIFNENQEITFDKKGIIGFDTAHYYNTAETSSYEYVKEQLEKILKEYKEELCS